MKKIEVLCAIMHQSDFQKVDEMKINCDVIFANQCGKNRYDVKKFENFTAKMISTDTVGVGINRNIALLYAEGDICIMADNDVEYVEGYEQIVQKAFDENPQADAIVFNVDRKHTKDSDRFAQKTKKVRFYNWMNYATPRIAVRTNILKKNNIFFNRCFGGGTGYSCGEDTLFMRDMLKNKMKVYTYPATIAVIHKNTSTWFNGYNEKFFYDKGALFAAISKFFSPLLCIYYLLRHPQEYKSVPISFFKAYCWMRKGSKGFENLKYYDASEW